MMMVWLNTVTELMGPYTSLCFAQWTQSWSFGRSKRLPTNGSGFGPGGSLKPPLDRTVRSMIIPTRNTARRAEAASKTCSIFGSDE